MAQRPISAETRKWLETELDVWRAGGIVNLDQGGRILDLYESTGEITQRRRSAALLALSGLAALMIGLAVLLLVGYNWEAMSAAAKLTVLFGGLLGVYGAAFWLRFQSSRQTAAEVLFFLGSLLYGVCIWQIAQIFHIQSHYPDGIWYWALGVLPLALCLDTVLVHALYVGLLAVWVGTEILGFDSAGLWWWNLRHSASSLPLMVLPGLLWAYHRQSAVSVALYAPLLAWWAVLQPAAWHWEVNPIYFIGLAGALLLLVAELHRVDSRLAVPYRLYGVLITGGVLAPLSFSEFVISLQHYQTSYNLVAGLVIALIGALATLGTVLLQQREMHRRMSKLAISAALLRRQWLPLMIIVLLTALCLWNGAFRSSQAAGYYYYHSAYAIEKWTLPVLIPLAAVNVAMVVLAIWLMRVGLREDRSLPFAAGVLYFLLWTVLRYVDLFAGVGGMLGAALMFLVCGVGLLAVARFWTHRKAINNV